MTLTIQQEHIYFFSVICVLLLQLYNIRKVNKIEKEVDSIWHQISVMAIASGGAFDKLQKKIDEKQDKE